MADKAGGAGWSDPERRRIARFLATGALNTGFGYGVYALLLRVGARPTAALAVSTVAGVLFNYRSLSQLVFADRGHGRFWRFVLVYAAQLAANMVLLNVLVHAGLNALLAQALLLPLFVVGAFVALRRFVFPPSDG